MSIIHHIPTKVFIMRCPLLYVIIFLASNICITTIHGASNNKPWWAQEGQVEQAVACAKKNAQEWCTCNGPFDLIEYNEQLRMAYALATILNDATTSTFLMPFKKAVAHEADAYLSGKTTKPSELVRLLPQQSEEQPTLADKKYALLRHMLQIQKKSAIASCFEEAAQLAQ